MSNSPAILPAVRAVMMQALAAGLRPKVGLPHLHVGRAKEVKALVGDLERVQQGGASFRIVKAEYGDGKSHLLDMTAEVARSKGFVVASADLTPERRLYGSKGEGRAFYRELMCNASTETTPSGGALEEVVSAFVQHARAEAGKTEEPFLDVVRRLLDPLTDSVGGFDFVTVISAYCRGAEENRSEDRKSALRWLRAEFTSKRDAHDAVGVRVSINDANYYDALKLFAQLARVSGFAGFIVCVDEMVNLFKLSNGPARRANYEQVLRILNDCLQGGAEGIGFILGGTPEFVEHPSKGLYSYEALKSRLAPNPFALEGLDDFAGPVLNLPRLKPEEVYVLLENIRHVDACGIEAQYRIPDDGIVAFLQHCHDHIGPAYFKTPRNIVVAFVRLLNLLEQNPSANWVDLLGGVQLDGRTDDAAAGEDGDNSELAVFTM